MAMAGLIRFHDESGNLIEIAKERNRPIMRKLSAQDTCKPCPIALEYVVS